MTPKEFKQLRINLGFESQDELAFCMGYKTRNCIAISETKKVNPRHKAFIELLAEVRKQDQLIRFYEHERNENKDNEK